MQLHYYPSTAAMIPHILLEELGVPYERVLVDRTQNRHKEPAYLRLNPNGLIPVCRTGTWCFTNRRRSAASVRHPPARRTGAGAGHAAAGALLQMVDVAVRNTLQPTLSAYFYPERWVARATPRPPRR